MSSKLFQTASASVRGEKRRAFQRSPLRKMQRDLNAIRSGTSGQAMRTLYRSLASPETKALMKALGAATKYSNSGDQAAQLDRLMGMLGPVGRILRRSLGPNNGAYTQDSYNAAVDMIRAMGGEVLVGKGKQGHERGLAAAQQMLEEAGYKVTPPGARQSVGRDQLWEGAGGDGATTGWLYDAEERVSSSTVYSYAFSQQTENYGTLYVTFLAWTPGGGKGDGPGATYAYHNITLDKYQGFKNAAKSSAGSAVWDYLRVRGSSHGHQHPYELVSGVQVQGRGPYVPRKVTAEGFMGRSIQDPHRARGTWIRSGLPSREFMPNRGEPNRGGPNRGR